MGEMMPLFAKRHVELFNSPVEIGLRTAAILGEAYPKAFSLQRLVILDYLVVHSDDVEGGPTGLHPRTPHRSGELLVRRDALQKGLYLYMSRNLVQCQYRVTGIAYSATEHTGAYLDALSAPYTQALKERTAWLVTSFESMTDRELNEYVRSHIDRWGAEFELESVLWSEDVI